MVLNHRWSFSFFLFLMVETNFRCVLSNEVVPHLSNEVIQSNGRHVFDNFNERLYDLMALESSANEGHPLSVIKPPSDFNFLNQNTILKGQESQQIATIVKKDPPTAASEHSHHKDHSSGFKKSSGHKGGSGFKNSKGYEGGHQGNHAKKEDKGFYDKGGKTWGGADHKSNFHAKKESGKKGSKGLKNGKKGHHNKGTKTKGFKNVLHKEESGVSSSFYNDADKKKYHKKYDHLDSYFQSKKGGSEKGSEFKGDKQHDSNDKKGFFKKGSAHDDKGEHKSEFGKSGHHDHKNSFLKKDGTKSYGGKGGHDGHASHSNAIPVIASGNAIKPTIIKPLNPESVPEDMVIAEQNEIKDTKKIKIHNKNPERGTRKKAREQINMTVKKDFLDAKPVDEDKSEAILEAAIITNGKQLSHPLSHKVKNGLNDTLSFQINKLTGIYPQLKMFQTAESSDSGESGSDSSIVTSTTHEHPKMELLVRKKTPKSTGYSYIKKSTTPMFSNCTGDSSKECTTYTKNSRSTVVVEYTDSDYPDNDEQDYQGETDKDYSQPELSIIDNNKNILPAEEDVTKVVVVDNKGNSKNYETNIEKVTTPTKSVSDKPISHEALLLLLAQLQKAQSLSKTSTTTESDAVLTTEMNPLTFGIKRRRKSNNRNNVSSTTTQASPASTKVPEYDSLIERRRKRKLDKIKVQNEKRKKMRELALEKTKSQLDTAPKKETVNVVNATQNAPIMNNRLDLRDRSAYRERLAARRERLVYATKTDQDEKVSKEDRDAELMEDNKIDVTQKTIEAAKTEKLTATLDKSPFLVPNEWDSRRVDEATTLEAVAETTTLPSRNRWI